MDGASVYKLLPYLGKNPPRGGTGSLNLQGDACGKSEKPPGRGVKFLKVVPCLGVPWVPEPQNLNERKLVRRKDRRKKG